MIPCLVSLLRNGLKILKPLKIGRLCFFIAFKINKFFKLDSTCLNSGEKAIELEWHRSRIEL
jgi:hypothetical protein